MGTSEGGGPFKLAVVNALWSQQGLTLQAPFLDTLAADHGAGVRLEDFVKSPENARALRTRLTVLPISSGFVSRWTGLKAAPGLVVHLRNSCNAVAQ